MVESLRQPVFERLALTLLHCLWQGAAIAVLVAILLKSLDRRRPGLRYATGCVGMLMFIAAPVATFFMVDPLTADGEVVVTTASGEQSHEEKAVQQPENKAAPTTRAEDTPSYGRTPAVMPSTAGDRAVPVSTGFRSAFSPCLVLIWLFGVALFGLRLLLGFVGVRPLLRHRTEPSFELQETVRRMAQTMKLATVPALSCSRRISEAMVVGFFRPVILLPAAWIAQMPRDVLESVLAHELAHIRRFDQWVNLLQRIVEVLLFYHPAVWWLSRQIRIERECCCDLEAAHTVGDTARYAEALEAVGRMKLTEKKPLLATSLGGTNMALLKRVRRVLGTDRPASGWDRWAVGLLAVCIPLMLLVASAWWPTGPAKAAAGVVDDGDKDRKKGDRRRDGDKRREEKREVRKDRKDGDREKRGDRDKRRAGDRRERGEKRDGDRDRREGNEKRDRERGERDQRKNAERGERDGDRRRDNDRRRDGERRRDGDRGAERRAPVNLKQLVELVRDLRAEVQKLRREVQELKGRRRGVDRVRVRKTERSRYGLDRRTKERERQPREGDRKRDEDRKPQGERKRDRDRKRNP